MTWNATIEVSSPRPSTGIGWYTAYVIVEGDNDADALAGAQWALNALASGKEACLRGDPMVGNNTIDAELRSIKHCGIARFSFKDEPGVWHKRLPLKDDTSPLLHSFGAPA